MMKKTLDVATIDEACMISDSAKCYESDEFPATLVLKLNELQRGHFKEAIFGTVTPKDSRTLFEELPGTSTQAGTSSPSNTIAICAKQMVHRTPSGDVIPFDRRKQARELTPEVQCIVWAKPLLRLVYKYMADFESKALIPPPFAIPRLRFVGAFLAYEQEGDKHSVYLVEEKIEGGFRKYINNDVACPLPRLRGDEREIADFLAFTQHVQHWQTMKLAFITDYQGTSRSFRSYNNLG